MLKTRLISPDRLDEVRRNNGYCLCAVIYTDDMRCPCKEFRSSAIPCVCGCGVWEKIEASPTPADEVAKEQAERSAEDLTGHDL